MALLMRRMRRTRVVFLCALLLYTCTFAVANLRAEAEGCCGVGDVGSCVLEPNYVPCDSDPDCRLTPDFPVCCAAGGFCNR